MARNKFFVILAFLFAPISALGDVESRFAKLSDITKAHGACSSYIGHMYSDYIAGGFASEKAAKRIQQKHRLLAGDAATELVTLLITEDVGGQKLIFNKGNQICMGEVCFAKREYLEAIILFGSLDEGADKVSRKSISCPAEAWFPGTGGEPVDNRLYKAKDLYKKNNCSLLLP